MFQITQRGVKEVISMSDKTKTKITKSQRTVDKELQSRTRKSPDQSAQNNTHDQPGDA